jgi:hypothetical protein
MHRSEVINKLIIENNYKSYLEIGTSVKKNCFDRIVCDKKICVDPAKNDQIYDYNITSDEFFKINQDKFDIVFIDGLHTAEQSYKDIINSLIILNDNGSIVVHDTNPPTEFHTVEKQYPNNPARPSWNGPVWKSIFRLRKTDSNLKIYTYSFDWGVTVIQRGPSELLNIDNEFYSYDIFDKHRKEILNIIK